MERQNSTPPANSKAAVSTVGSSPIIPPTSSSGVVGTPTSPKRKKRKNNGVLFSILRCFAVLGPLGFTANIAYFQFYVHTSNGHGQHGGPFNAISSSFQDRADRYNKQSGVAVAAAAGGGTTKSDETRRITEKDVDSNSDNSESVKKDSSEKNDALPPPAAAATDEKEKGTTPPVMSGRQVLDRMQSQTTSSWKACGSSPKSTTALTQQLRDEPQQGNLRVSNNREGVLQPFALRLSLEEHLKEMQHAEKEEEENDDEVQQQHCWIPQRGTLNCDADTYSIIVTFQGRRNFRPLFMNLLAWLTYPYISDIVVLMPHADWATDDHTIMDAKYKERIKTWHANKNHKVFMIGLPKKIEDDPSSKYSFDTLLKKTMARVKSDAVLFMDGTIIWDGNNRGITAGFELWKQNPHGVIATHKLHTGSPESFCQKSPGRLWTPFCQSGANNLPSDLPTLHQQYQNILDLNGVFVHRGMLCLLGQDPLASILRKNVWKSLDDMTDPQQTFAYTRAILSIALLQIGGGPPLLFPPTIARPSNETQDYNNNWHYLPHISELEYLEEVTANNTIIQKRTLLSLLGYFGNALVANSNEGDMVPYWCTAKKEVEGVFFITDIPWMEASGSKCKRVAANADVLKPIM